LKFFSHNFSSVVYARFWSTGILLVFDAVRKLTGSAWIKALIALTDKQNPSLNQIDQKCVLRKGRDPSRENRAFDFRKQQVY
jgi:hypothetical protein